MQEKISSDLNIKEGVNANWTYHLSEKDAHRALCGKRVMSCGLSLDQWGNIAPNHLPITFCSECEQEREQQALSSSR